MDVCKNNKDLIMTPIVSGSSLPFKGGTKRKRQDLQLKDLPLEVTELIASYLPKRDVASFGQISELYRDLTDRFWTAEVKREGFDLFSKIDPTLAGKRQYLFTRAIFKFLSQISTEPLTQNKVKFLKTEFEWVKAEFPQLHSLFLYMLYEREDLKGTPYPMAHVYSRESLSSGLLEFRTSPNIYDRPSEEIRRVIYDNDGTDEGASILQFYLDQKHLYEASVNSKAGSFNSPIAAYLTINKGVNCLPQALRAAENNDFRALDRLFEDAYSVSYPSTEDLDNQRKYYPPVLLQLAGQALNEGRLEDAEGHIMEAHDGYGSNVPFDYFILLAKLKLLSDKPAEAEAVLNQAMELFTPKSNYMFLHHLYAAKSRLKKWEEAKKIAYEIKNWGIKMDRRLLAEASLNLGEFEEANQEFVVVLNQLNKLDRNEQAEYLKVFADAAYVKMRRGHYGESDKLFSQAMSLQRDFPETNSWGNKIPADVLAFIAENKLKLQQWPESRAFFQELLKCYEEAKRPVPAFTLNNAAHASFMLGNYEEARGLLSKAIEAVGGISKATQDMLNMKQEIEAALEEKET